MRGKIHGTFHTSLNLNLGKLLVHLGPLSAPLCCFGIAVEDEFLQELLKNCKSGDLVVLRENVLTIYGLRIFRLELAAFTTRELSIPVREKTDQRSQKHLLQLLPEVWQLGIPQNQELKEHVRMLTEISSEEAGQEAVHWFLGRGQGLTPAGDDILTGFGLALTVWSSGQLFLDALRRQDLSRTTEVSAAYLNALMDGYVNEDMKELLQVLDHEDDQQLLWRIEKIQRLGHTSGEDTLYGLSIGLTALNKY